MLKRKVDYDKIILIIAECYISLPIFIFMFGWLKLVYAFIGCVSITGLLIMLYRSLTAVDNVNKAIISGKNLLFWTSVIVVSGIWVFLSGIGGYAYQNSDFWARNPVFNDLSTYSWPIIYDLSEEPEIVKSICGNGEVTLSYYFSWWLPVCLVAKIFRLSYGGRNLLLYLWALLGILLILYLICRKFRKCSWIIPIIFITFSGLDAVPFLIKNNFSEIFPWIQHMEWWADYFQYSSNTTQLFWVFNQSIPIWLIMSILIQLEDSNCIAGLLSISFAYSAWATFGMIPYAIYASVKGKNEIKSAINVFNISVPIIILIVFGTFYASNSVSGGYIGLIFMQYPNMKMQIICNYLLFVLVEVGLYFLALGKEAFHYKYYRITIFELLLFPLFIVVDSNFVMRCSIPALFMLMIYVIKYLIESRDSKVIIIRKFILIGFLVIGFLTPFSEINRSLIHCGTNDNILQEQVGSFGNIQTDSETIIYAIKTRLFVYDYQEKTFFKYLAR